MAFANPKGSREAHLLLLTNDRPACKICVTVVGAWDVVGFSSAARKERSEVAGLRKTPSSAVTSLHAHLSLTCVAPTQGLPRLVSLGTNPDELESHCHPSVPCSCLAES